MVERIEGHSGELLELAVTASGGRVRYRAFLASFRSKIQPQPSPPLIRREGERLDVGPPQDLARP